ncbi:MAG: hypothetical protein ACI4VN_05265 [Clostridia bacterium]
MGKRNIQIIPGDGNIEISPAEDHINDIYDNEKKKPRKEEIVVPTPKKKEDE